MKTMMEVFAILASLAGSFLAVLAGQKLTDFRLRQLEEKVDKHNNVVERMALAEKDIKVANHRIEDLEDKAEEHGELSERVTIVERDVKTAFTRIDDLRGGKPYATRD